MKDLRGYTDHKTIEQQLSDLHAECCISPAGGGGLPNLLSDDQIEKLITDLLRYIFKNQTIAGAPEALKNYFIDQLLIAVFKGFGNKPDDFDFDTPDYNMLTALQADVIKFSAAKNNTMNKAIARELIGPDGKLREWNDFKIAAHQITTDHTDAWLRAEYNLAITSAQAASKWIDIEKNSSLLPVLVFDAIMDGRTTEICRNFNGIRLPVNHLFWDQYYPPNHYNERSIVRQDTDNGELTDVTTIVYPDKIPDIFKINLPKLKFIFPPGHPYYKGIL